MHGEKLEINREALFPTPPPNDQNLNVTDFL